ncbi:MAG: hypothetical protein UW83_C0009G0007 [Parcubacteria group bacterium GW2011_GWD1_44_9]|nr:MAG: hypothetical protein UV94_C0001G0013 [Parcubacteria group bacterium GW2011_GWC1_43_30]KKT85752.1 MAG: hypothetical protein UW83_C0009G0007 [Parcubacteria group bacterium GW2011_GWD1_44_9]
MPDEPQNLIPTENSIPVSSQEPILEAPIPPSTSEPVAVPPQTPESPTEAESTVPVNVDNPEISPVEPENLAPEQTAQTENPSVNEPISEAPIQPTAHIPVFEPLAKLSLLAKAREMIQFRKRKKLEKIMGMFLKKAEITNDEVEKLLHVSDATATRYLEQLEKEGKIKQEGRTGQSVSYTKL